MLYFRLIMWQYSAAPGKLYPYAVLGTVKLKRSIDYIPVCTILRKNMTKGTLINAVFLLLHCNAASILFQ